MKSKIIQITNTNGLNLKITVHNVRKRVTVESKEISSFQSVHPFTITLAL